MIVFLIPLALVLVAVAFFSYYRTIPALTRKWAVTLGVLRSIALVLIVVLLGDPRCMRKATVVDKPLVVTLIDNSQSMSLPASTVGDDRQTDRFHEALYLEKKLADGVRVEGGVVRSFFFSSDLASAESDTSSPKEQGTDILKTLNTTYRKFEGENIAAIVVLSDGIETTGEIKRPGFPPVPVFTIGVGDTSTPEDVRIDEVDYSSIVRTPARTTITARIVNSAVQRKRVKLSLDEAGRVLFTKDLVIPPESSMEEKIRLDLPSPGKRTLMLKAAVQGFDAEKENNRREIVIVGEKGEVRTLIVDMFPGWDLHFFLEFLKAEKTYEFDFMGRKAAYVGDEAEDPDVFASILNDYDVLVLFSLAPGFIDSGKAALIRDFVEKAGKGLLVLPGDHSVFALSEPQRSLLDLMPFSGIGHPKFRMGYVSLTSGKGSLDSPIVSDLAPVISQTKWQERAPLLGRYLNLKPKEGAEVLLETKDDGEPALTYYEAGLGRVIAVTAGPLWRWKFLPEQSKVYDDLMARILDVLAHGERGERFAISTGKNVFQGGEPVGVFAELYDKKLRPVAGVPVRLEVFRIEDGGEVPVKDVLMQKEGAESVRFKAAVQSLDPGLYKLRAEAELPGGKIKSNSLEIKISDVSLEFRKVKLDRQKLEIIAAGTGGRYADAGSIAGLVEEIKLEEKISTVTSQRLLRADAVMFAAIIILLAVEWIIRKRVGMI